MNFKILFVLLILVLLSSAVFADVVKMDKPESGGGGSETPETETPDPKAEKAVPVSETHETKGGKDAEDKVYRLPDMIVRAPKKSSDEEPEKAPEEIKAPPKKPKKVSDVKRQTIFERGWYSFYDIIDAYDDYSGINQYSALFFGEEWLAKRRQMAAEYFCEKTLLLGGKQCWQSKICEGFYNSKEPPVGRSVLVAQAGIGGYEPAVSIQGERSLPITYKEDGKSKRRYVYKLTYFISNPHDRALTYSIKLIGPSKEFTSPGMTLSRATENNIFRDERLGNNPLITESDNYYETACLAFNPRMVAAGGRMIGARRVSEICAPLVSYDGAATRPYTEIPEEDLPASQPQAGQRTEVESDPLKNA